MSRTGRESDQIKLRLPDGMRERIKATAAANGRSMNAEVLARLDAEDFSRRDQIASIALAGMLAHGSGYNPSAIAAEAYELADAMLEASKTSIRSA